MEKDETNPEGEQAEQTTEQEEVQPESTDPQSEQPQEGDGSGEEDYRAKLNAQNRFLEKEGYEFKDGKWQKPQQPEQEQGEGEPEGAPSSRTDDLSSRDVIALTNAQVPEEDIDEVIKASKLLETDVKGALRDDMVKDMLRKRQEHRQSSQAANTGNARPSTKTPTSDEVLQQASEGNLPDPGSKEAEELFWARRGGRPQDN